MSSSISIDNIQFIDKESIVNRASISVLHLFKPISSYTCVLYGELTMCGGWLVFFSAKQDYKGIRSKFALIDRSVKSLVKMRHLMKTQRKCRDRLEHCKTALI